MKYVNTNPHRILVVVDGERIKVQEGAEKEATGEVAKALEDTEGVFRHDSNEVAAWRRDQKIADAAGSGDASQAAGAFDPEQLTADEAIEAINRVTEPNVLREIARNERQGKDRTTVHDAISSRAKSLEVDLSPHGGEGTTTSEDASATGEDADNAPAADAPKPKSKPRAKKGSGTLTSDKVPGKRGGKTAPKRK